MEVLANDASSLDHISELRHILQNPSIQQLVEIENQENHKNFGSMVAFGQRPLAECRGARQPLEMLVSHIRCKPNTTHFANHGFGDSKNKSYVESGGLKRKRSFAGDSTAKKVKETMSSSPAKPDSTPCGSSDEDTDIDMSDSPGDIQEAEAIDDVQTRIKKLEEVVPHFSSSAGQEWEDVQVQVPVRPSLKRAGCWLFLPVEMREFHDVGFTAEIL